MPDVTSPASYRYDASWLFEYGFIGVSMHGTHRGALAHTRNEEKKHMTPTIDIHSSLAVYVQIENYIQFAIAAGRLKAGDQLPTVHELSKQLSVNVNTVAKSYRDLEVMGLLYTRRGKGVFVNKSVEAKCREDCHKRLIGRLHEVVSEAKAAGLVRKDILQILEASIKLDVPPYGETPKELLSLAKNSSKK
jgi:GntR family transcriptional regulator